jgi:4-hydroxy-3-methylbut-2-enyl diphosphate reductase
MAQTLAERREQSVRHTSSSIIYTYGPLIHNKMVLRMLEEQHVHVLRENFPEDLHGALVVIRAHGVPPETEAALRKAGAVIKDATCPKVKANQLLARKLGIKAGDGRGIVFLAGDRQHAEIQGIVGYAPECVCVSNETEAENAARSRCGENAGKITAVLMAQTTFPVEDYRKITAVLQNYFPRFVAHNTICPATACRQEALRKLCAHVDAVIIAGGKESANTKALAEIARGRGKETLLVEDAGEARAFASRLPKTARIGLAAGASTPLSVIDEIEQVLRESRQS